MKMWSDCGLVVTFLPELQEYPGLMYDTAGHVLALGFVCTSDGIKMGYHHIYKN